MNLDVTVVITTLNEESSIDALLQALNSQSYLPSEIVIVDGGSVDKTMAMIREFAEKTPYSVQLLSLPGSNRSQARNYGILQASYSIIAVTDAGCIPNSDWLEELLQPFTKDRKAEVVAGYYSTDAKTVWEKVVSDFTSVQPWNFNEKTFLPSSRSIAFTKSIWKEVGGYPERLSTCEDLIFAEKLKQKAKHWYVNKKAIVSWPQPQTIRNLTQKTFHYALGDLHAKYDRHVKKIYSAIWRVVILFFVATPFLISTIPIFRYIGIGLWALYGIGSIVKHRRVLVHPVAIVYIFFTQLFVDISLLQAWVSYWLHKTIGE